jgi:hypothetical protein
MAVAIMRSGKWPWRTSRRWQEQDHFLPAFADDGSPGRE